jgi:hypothetical protein
MADEGADAPQGADAPKALTFPKAPTPKRACSRHYVEAAGILQPQNGAGIRFDRLWIWLVPAAASNYSLKLELDLVST